MTASTIIELLAARHGVDLFVPECKVGGTWTSTGDALRLDAWAMRKSWTDWRCIGYEVKVSRSDFTRDRKWRRYLPYCHEFYFVCPAGLIRTDEVPDGAGLIWAGPRLRRKVTAPWHEPDPARLMRLMAYILMWRVPAHSRPPRDLDGVRTRQQMVEEAEARGRLAEFVARHVRDMVSQARADREEAHRKEHEVAAFCECLRTDLGIEYRPWDGFYMVINGLRKRLRLPITLWVHESEES